MKSINRKNNYSKEENKMKENKKRNQGFLSVYIWNGGRQGDLDSGTWHGGRQGDLDSGTWHGGRQGDLDSGTWHGGKQGDLDSGTWHGGRALSDEEMDFVSCIPADAKNWTESDREFWFAVHRSSFPSVYTWNGGRQGDLDGGTWHGGKQGDLDDGTWHGGRQGDLDGGTWHGGRQGDLDSGTWHWGGGKPISDSKPKTTQCSDAYPHNKYDSLSGQRKGEETDSEGRIGRQGVLEIDIFH